MTQITTGIRSILSHPMVYDKFQQFMGAHAARTDFSQNMIKATHNSRVLDLGCGTADILSFLPEGVEYLGYDISESYIAAAKARFGDRGHFCCQWVDEKAIAGMPPFNIVLACGVLHHLDDTAVSLLLKLASQALRKGGRFVSIDPVFTENQNYFAKFLISRDRGQYVRDVDGYTRLAKQEFETVNGMVRHRTWIPYTHWTMECVV